MHLISPQEIQQLISTPSTTKKKATANQKKQLNGYLNIPNFANNLNRDHAEIILKEIDHRISDKISKNELYLNIKDIAGSPNSKFAVWKTNELLHSARFYEQKSTSKQRDYICRLLNLSADNLDLIQEVHNLNKGQASILIDHIKSETLNKHLEVESHWFINAIMSVFKILFYAVFGIFFLLIALDKTSKK